MEMAYDSVDPEERKAWIVDDIYFDPEFRDDTGALLSRTAAPDILDVTADLASDMLFSEFDLNMVSHRHVNESGLDQLPWAPWGLINNNQHFDWTPDPTSTTTTSLTNFDRTPDPTSMTTTSLTNFDRTPDPTSMTTTSLTSSRSDSIWSPSSGNLTFTSPLVSMDTPSLTPDFFALQSPQNHTDSFSGDPIITSESVTGNTDGITDYIADYTVAASAMLGIEELPTQVAAAPRLLTIGDCPPGVPMYGPPASKNTLEDIDANIYNQATVAQQNQTGILPRVSETVCI